MQFPNHKPMDKIFERGKIEQDSMLCEIQTEILQAILKFLPGFDIMHLSHTCKELYQKLPFCLVKGGEFFIRDMENANMSRPWFKGSAINLSVSKINMVINLFTADTFAIWIQIIRSGKIVHETEKHWITKGYSRFQFTKKNSVLREYKPGDRLWFMVGASRFIPDLSDGYGPYFSEENEEEGYFRFGLSLQLENYKYGKEIYDAKEVKGYPEITEPSVSRNLPNLITDLKSCRLSKCPLEGNTYLLNPYFNLSKSRKCKPENCPCRFCKVYVQNINFV